MRVNLLNGCGVALVCVLSLGAVAWVGAARSRPLPPPPGAAQVADHAGRSVAVQPWQRIASVSMTSDAALLATCAPDRVVCWSAFSTGPDAFRLSGPRLNGLDDLEAIIALRPDLVLVSTYGGEADRIGRLRDAGLTVFELGAMEGLASLRRDFLQVGALVGHPQRAERAINALERRMHRIAAHLPADQRPGAVYVAPIGEVLFGGTTGTSYHDVITAAGLTDLAAASGRTGWPQYSVEQVLALRPAIVVTKIGSEEALRRLPGFSQLSARIVAVDAELLEDPGPAMLEAAEALHAAVFANAP
jgi:iron complex transport system substrate-binding protein